MQALDVDKILQTSDDRATLHTVAQLDTGNALHITVALPALTAKHFRTPVRRCIASKPRAWGNRLIDIRQPDAVKKYTFIDYHPYISQSLLLPVGLFGLVALDSITE